MSLVQNCTKLKKEKEGEREREREFKAERNEKETKDKAEEWNEQGKKRTFNSFTSQSLSSLKLFQNFSQIPQKSFLVSRSLNYAN